MATTRVQSHFRFRNDDGSESAASWLDALDKNITPTVGASNKKLRLRINVRQTGTTSATFTGRLYKSKNGGAYAQIGSGDTDGLKVVDSTNLTDDAATTQQISSGGSGFVAGKVDDVNGQCSATASMAQNRDTEHEFMLQLDFANLSNGDFFDLRIRNSTTAIDTYTVTPRITVTKNTPPTVALNSPADAASVADTTPDLQFTATDANSDDVEFEVQVDTVNTFDSSLGTEALDNSQTSNGTGFGFGEFANVRYRGQVFTAGSSGKLTKIGFNRTKGSQGIKVYIDTVDGSNLPSHTVGSELYSFTIPNASVIDGYGEYALPVGLNVTAGTKYCFYLASWDTGSDAYADDYQDCHGLNATTGGVTEITNVAGSWSTENLCFHYKTYITPVAPLLDKLSETDAGFVNVDNGADTHPFTAGNQMKYTVQAGDALSVGTTYYWRVRANDPSGSNGFGAWATTRSFSITNTTQHSLTKSTQYAIKYTPTAKTESLKYCVKVTPTAPTKSLSYRVKTTTAPTKSLKYTVTKANSTTKSLKYCVKITPAAKTKGLIYQIVQALSKTKSAQYAIKTSQPKTKAQQYAVKTSQQKTKSLQYGITTQASKTKGLVYAVKKAIALTKALAYEITTPTAITKSTRYAITTPGQKTKSTQYAITTQQVKTKGLTYEIEGTAAHSIERALTYAIQTQHSLEKALAYSIVKPGTITKSLQYEIKQAEQIAKTLTYALQTTQAKTKSLTYAIAQEEALTKSLTYSVKLTNLLQKAERYAIRTTAQKTKSLTYAIEETGSIQKPLKYAIKTTAQKSLAQAYAIKTTAAIKKSLAYSIATGEALQKTLTYLIKAEKVKTKSLKYVVRVYPYTDKTSPFSRKDTPYTEKTNPFSRAANPYGEKTSPYERLRKVL